LASHVRVEVTGALARITLDNPDKRNAVSTSMWRALEAAAVELAARRDVRAVALTGAGERAFSGGADIGEFGDARSGSTTAGYDDLVESACRALESLPQTTVAIIRGACAGAGNSIAASCDFRIAADDACFLHPAVLLGLGYDPRGIARFLRVYGPGPTRYLLLAGARLPAARGHALGVVDEIHPATALEAAAAEALQRFSLHAPLAVAAAKAALRALAPQPDAVMLAHALDLARHADSSADYEEGRRAFEEKRKPRFEGR
jgi:enoyl-CoA hydratase/carnithine racemase